MFHGRLIGGASWRLARSEGRARIPASGSWVVLSATLLCSSRPKPKACGTWPSSRRLSTELSAVSVENFEARFQGLSEATALAGSHRLPSAGPERGGERVPGRDCLPSIECVRTNDGWRWELPFIVRTGNWRGVPQFLVFSTRCPLAETLAIAGNGRAARHSALRPPTRLEVKLLGIDAHSRVFSSHGERNGSPAYRGRPPPP